MAFSLVPQMASGAGESRPVELDFVRYFPLARVSHATDEIEINPVLDRKYLSAGWHPIQKDVKEGGFAWTRGRDAVIDFALVSPQDLRVELDLEPIAAEGKLPRQNLEVLWNGHHAGSFSLAWQRQTIRFRVPASWQHHGPNRIDLMPLYWLDPMSAGVSLDRRKLGVRLWNVRLVSKDPEITASKTPVRADAETGALLQTPGSVVTWYFALPHQARLRGRVRLLDADTLPASARGRVQLSVLDERGRERALYTRDLAEFRTSPEFEIDADLSDLAGQMAAISLSFSLRESGRAPGVEAVRLEWKRPRIEGRSDSLPSPDLDGLRGRHNVLVILFDTLRADFTEPYGADVETPAMRALAQSGVTFQNAFSNSSWTRPSVASILTSLYPSAHGVLSPGSAVPDDLPFLPELLAGAGYQTVAISNNAHTASNFGFARGFDQLHEYFRVRPEIVKRHPAPEAQAKYVWDTYIEPVASRAAKRPFFVFLHEIDPHAPYAAPPPYDEKYDFGYQGNVMGYRVSVDETLKLMRAINEHPRWLADLDVRYLRSQYAAEVTFVDRYLGWVLERLEKSGLRESTLVVLLSDHGEEFMEHQRWGHGRAIYDELLRVPLILSLPGVLPAGRRPSAHVQLIDLSPTILDLLGIARPPVMQGRSLLPYAVLSEDVQPARPTFAKSNIQFAPKESINRANKDYDSIRFRNWKLVRFNTDRRFDEQFEFELYDLDADPGEQHDRWPTQLVVGRTLQQMLAWQHRIDESIKSQAPREGELDEGVIENLRALGYIE